MTEITAPKSPVTAEQFADEIREQLKYTQNVTVEQATPADVYVAASKAVRNHLADSWFKTQADTVNGNTKAVGYLSAEFLMGKQLENALLNAGLADQFDKAVEALGFKPKDIVDAEYEPGLGNGGLGRLAACFIDSLASLGVPAFGYGIQYKYGIFKQKFDENGKQVETPDYWLANEEPWGHTDYNRDQKVSFGGKVVENADGTKTWQPAWSVRAVPVDYLVPGYKSGRVNTLRLWTAKSYDEFDLLAFNRSEYMDAVAPQVKAENISKILYPEDSTKVGKELRLEQQYFFVSASLHDAIRVFYPGQDKPDLTTFPNKIVFQLNDTHPVIGIPELMRILIDVYGYDWDTAWSITTKTFNYTCHTLLPEALEVWPASLIGELLPRHLEIIEKINAQFEAELKAKGVAADTIKDMAIYTGDAVRMAYLATYGGSHVNGVAELHSQLLKDVTLKNFSDVYPDKFTNVTNGVTPRRFVKLANPRLSDLITEGLGTDKWVADLELLKGLEPLAKDDEFVKKFAAVKKANKHAFVGFAKDHYGIDIDENTLFNTMVKRLHEYKRQSLKILAVISNYADIKSGKVKAEDITPRTVFFGAKAAPGYYLAKMTIELINNVSRVISSDPAVKGKLAVHMLPNYNVEMAQNLIPATELDEQISQAGKEASGTGNMKFALNGALTVGTLDGANVEIRERVGAENFFLFGMTVDEVEKKYAEGYDPASYYEADPRLKQAIDLVADGTFSNGDRNAYSPLVADWLTKDWFMTLADFSAYMGIQSEIEALYADELEWNRKALLNVANSGYFSSDRSMEDYLERIWHTAPLA
ncbi:glycogen/starch/alpha-glucan phosphorylase [Bifidobacterium longum subsp. infantis]|uniref:Alpha-1,4 glucan phosphorylase n=1 Tax=Bifidobacterium longum subsp. infantis TaxID=1682 RepID=A0AAX1LLM6_BIFLI|nr:glycogen/starch/alpha-glucan phosphorylase [Bifidobacterium longum]QSP98082.1 glycogen/starch/alpha-glucan phosphorylase [Bifidobacterium longum subsp. infantis]QSZ18329.1 glycogen/starch/alpha-glucan phosphorylase [Bifidobacterium longum subsp. infantis]QTB92218.1 glycogen/starch/alpha-glucan phosphorylase [Bifidobacterium longum subsp. infantis]